MRSSISFAVGSILFAGLYGSMIGASVTPNVTARACGSAGSLICTPGSCCSGLFCSAQGVCSSCRTSGGFCDDKNVPCCSTGGANGGPLYCSTPNVCRSCLTSGAFCDAKVPCCSTGGVNGGPLYCGSNGVCRGCITSGAFTDPRVPCCNGQSNTGNFC
ncbi:hypothetical protein B0H15DRAFT_28572 [Mycena belliarum]|uniref:Uncharacterized protein n=1 Tax=Mycena belliarum TaxID=1033014 RepID=A0AAD6UJZ5_9AGAR|nr:hypothetical protein B0H15DRAFT_28572 [Mycena belliae]